MLVRKEITATFFGMCVRVGLRVFVCLFVCLCVYVHVYVCVCVSGSCGIRQSLIG